jgi:hypothetical protein
MNERAAQWWDPRTWLAFAFWELHTILKGYSGDAYAAWSATGFLIVVEILALGALSSAWSVYHGRRLNDHYIFIVALAVIILNVGAAWGGNKRRRRLHRCLRAIQCQLKLGAAL